MYIIITIIYLFIYIIILLCKTYPKFLFDTLMFLGRGLSSIFFFFWFSIFGYCVFLHSYDNDIIRYIIRTITRCAYYFTSDKRLLLIKYHNEKKNQYRASPHFCASRLKMFCIKQTNFYGFSFPHYFCFHLIKGT